MGISPTDGESSSDDQDRLTVWAERSDLVLARAALDGLGDLAAARLLDDDELDQALVTCSGLSRQ